MATRVVHLEVAASLTTYAILLAIHRFIGRCGYPLEGFLLRTRLVCIAYNSSAQLMRL